MAFQLFALSTVASIDVDLAARPWMDASKTPDERTALLLPLMSLEEKVNQMLHVWTTVKDVDIISKYGNTSVGAMYLTHLSANMSCDALPTCRLAARNALQKKLVEGSTHGIPISFVTESLHSPMRSASKAAYINAQGDVEAPTPCATAIAKYCPHLQGPKCKACVAQHSTAILPACPTPGQVDKACGTFGSAILGTIFPMPAG